MTTGTAGNDLGSALDLAVDALDHYGDGTMAFNSFGVECLRQLISMHRNRAADNHRPSPAAYLDGSFPQQ